MSNLKLPMSSLRPNLATLCTSNLIISGNSLLSDEIKLKVPKKIMINQNRSYPNNFLMETKKIPKKILRIMISLQKRQLIKMINNLKNRVSRPQSKSSKKFLSLKRVSFLKELLGCIRRLNLKKLQSLSRNVRDRKNS